MKGRVKDAITPTRAALLQHIKRAVYQGGHCWGKMLQATIGMQLNGDWGWVDPQLCMWTTLPEASIASRQLIHCGCKRGVQGAASARKQH